mmetsp:Transcript_87288/g.137804  ORF Transcript_87288/g.137804 Transcript_87288/m.137804 type:complete len:141 (+) Transcript_87288:222-644(+)
MSCPLSPSGVPDGFNERGGANEVAVDASGALDERGGDNPIGVESSEVFGGDSDDFNRCAVNDFNVLGGGGGANDADPFARRVRNAEADADRGASIDFDRCAVDDLDAHGGGAKEIDRWGIVTFVMELGGMLPESIITFVM